MRLLITTVLLCSVALVARAADDCAKTAEVKQPELSKELLRRFKIDQAARQAVVDWTKQNGNPPEAMRPNRTPPTAIYHPARSS